MLLLAQAAPPVDRFSFDAVKDDVGMVVIAVIVLVTWFLFRRMWELSEQKKHDDKR